jgi:DNA-directed RNA polymerase subunit RPC12/RpoP
METNIEITNLKCKSCGGTLETVPGSDRAVCPYCGTEHLVTQSGEAVAAAHLQKVQEGIDRNTAELAIPRIEGEIRRLEQDWTNVVATPIGVILWWTAAVFVMLDWLVDCFMFGIFGNVTWFTLLIGLGLTWIAANRSTDRQKRISAYKASIEQKIAERSRDLDELRSKVT